MLVIFVDETDNKRDTMRKFGLRVQCCIAKKLLVKGLCVSNNSTIYSERVLDVKFINVSVSGEIFSQLNYTFYHIYFPSMAPIPTALYY